MRAFYITLVSHCEKVWWDAGYDGLRAAVDAMLALQERVGRVVGRPVTSTFCTFVDHPTSTSAVIDAHEAPDVPLRILDTGNELGLHVHAPVGELRSGLQDRLIRADAGLLAGMALPWPVTYTAGDFVTSREVVACLEEAGIKVDCSVYTLQGPLDRFGARVDYTRRRDLRPYHPDRHYICLAGDSPIVELPVSGHLPEFATQEFARLAAIGERIARRYDGLRSGVDVFQVYWHPFEILTLEGKDNDALLASGLRPEAGRGTIGQNTRVLDAAEQALVEFARQADVEIACAAEAAACWAGSQNDRTAGAFTFDG